MDKEVLSRLADLEKKYNEQQQALKQKDEEIEQLRSEKPGEAEPVKREPEPVTVRTEVEAYELIIRRKGDIVRKFSTSGFQGRILYLMTSRMALRWARDEIISAAAGLGWKMDAVNTGRQMAALAGLGFLIRDEGPPVTFRLPEGVKITVEGE